MQIVAPSPQWPIVKDTGRMEDSFRLWTLIVSRLGIIIGTGSPEGVIDAGQTALYMDDAGAAGAVLYIKRDTDIAGDRTQGWILI
jgi:hypothetical protein